MSSANPLRNPDARRSSKSAVSAALPGIVAGASLEFDAIASRLRSMAIDNFSVANDVIRIGSADWRLCICTCGFTGCDGWALEPVTDGTESH